MKPVLMVLALVFAISNASDVQQVERRSKKLVRRVEKVSSKDAAATMPSDDSILVDTAQSERLKREDMRKQVDLMSAKFKAADEQIKTQEVLLKEKIAQLQAKGEAGSNEKDTHWVKKANNLIRRVTKSSLNDVAATNFPDGIILLKEIDSASLQLQDMREAVQEMENRAKFEEVQAESEKDDAMLKQKGMPGMKGLIRRAKKTPEEDVEEDPGSKLEASPDTTETSEASSKEEEAYADTMASLTEELEAREALIKANDALLKEKDAQIKAYAQDPDAEIKA